MEGLEGVKGSKFDCHCGNEILKKYGIFGKKELVGNTVMWTFTCAECGQEYFENLSEPLPAPQRTPETPANDIGDKPQQISNT